MYNNIINSRVVRSFTCILFMVAVIFVPINNNSIMKAKTMTKNDGVLNYKQQVSKGNAKKIARKHLDAVIYDSSNNGKKWGNRTKIANGTPLYDAEKKLCAYVFDLKEKEKDAGYIVVGCNENYPPIIEYSMEGKFVMDSTPLKESELIIYDGQLDYYKVDRDSELAMDIHTNEKQDLRNLEKKEGEKHTEEWQMMEAAFETDENSQENSQISTLSSTPPYAGNDFITNPFNYESGYIAYSNSFVPSYRFVKYLTMYDVPGHVHYCVPVAMTNMLMYWHERKFYKLMYGNSWKDSFELLYNFSGGSAEKDVKDAPRAFQKYLDLFHIKNANIRYYEEEDFIDSKTGKYSAEKAWELMKAEILGDAPFLLAINNHYNYADDSAYSAHAVLVLGYQEFKYSTKQYYTDSKYSRYLLIQDGWISTPDRYINTTVGYDYPNSRLVTFYFIGK
ncbi:MAG: hypothetical protein HFG37_01055 [Eubacterium sp.]|nr:hypothetical protein [Eubacterium sp.]MCI9410698.1 hypothetical protein [Eubacterium sp.]